MQVIKFNSAQDKYGYLSNLAAFPVLISNRVWPSSEHYFQAQKFAGTGEEESIRSADSAALARQLGCDAAKSSRPGWEEIKDEVMLTALRAKFRQHTDLVAKLLATDDAMLVEHTEDENYWGDGGDGRGRNRLGELLMQVREEMRQRLTQGRDA
jgi:N-glycosidase YbiA